MGSWNHLTEEINEIIHSSGSDTDSSNSYSEISGNICVDDNDIAMCEANDITNTFQFLVEIIKNSKDVLV